MSNAIDLLKSLAGVHASRVGGTAGTAQSATNAVAEDGQSFAALLEQARSGEIESGVPLRVPSHLGVELDGSQMKRMMKALDQAEAQGAGRAVVMMDGKGYTVDVGTRTLTGVIDMNDPSTTGVLDGVDAVVIAAADASKGNTGAAGAASAQGVLGMPKASPALTPQISKIFEDRGSENSAA